MTDIIFPQVWHGFGIRDLALMIQVYKVGFEQSISFCGAGTTGLVAYKLNRSFVGIELNPKYAEMARRRIGQEQGKYTLFEGFEP